MVGDGVAFVSRLSLQATEARHREALTAGRIERIAGLSGPNREAWVRLRGAGDSGAAEDRRPARHDWHEAVEQEEFGFVTRTSDHRVATTTTGATSWTMYESRLPVSATAPAR